MQTPNKPQHRTLTRKLFREGRNPGRYFCHAAEYPCSGGSAESIGGLASGTRGKGGRGEGVGD